MFKNKFTIIVLILVFIMIGEILYISGIISKIKERVELLESKPVNKDEEIKSSLDVNELLNLENQESLQGLELSK